jgi:hypothetical protein
MGIDIYAEWTGMSDAEKDAQITSVELGRSLRNRGSAAPPSIGLTWSFT